MTREEKQELNNLVQVVEFDWTLHARDKQLLPEGDWQTWLIKAGRGFGKTRTGAETVRIWKDHYPILHLVGATSGDVRDIMIEGESGLLNISPPWDKPKYEPSKRRITWENGAKAILFSADEPDRLRGPQCHKAWADELAAWRYPDAWDQLQLGLRLGDNPQCIVTTTPRPTKIIRELVKDQTTLITSASSYENKDNLAPAFFDKIIKKYEGTRLGRQELNAELLEDVEGALWNLALIEPNRVKEHPELRRIIIAIDPAVTANINSDETGIMVVGEDNNDHYYVMDDRSGIYTPHEWATKAIHSYHKLGADRVVAEVNNGGDLVETNIRTVDKNVSYKSVWAKKGKSIRAEPIVALYEQKRVHHVGMFAKLEDEMTTWDPNDPSADSPNRLDALVWGITFLMNKKRGGGFA